jgi:SAM-dependent methyltransferase
LTYYDRVARKWDEATGAQGGAFKRLVLNDRVLALAGDVAGRDVLELGAGNGYLARILWRRHSGREPNRLVVSDASERLLDIARNRYGVPRAEYAVLDVRRPFPFEAGSFDLVVAVMVLNELTDAAARRALGETARVVRLDGRLVGAVLHPKFVDGLSRRGLLRRGRPPTMPGPGELRLPVASRTVTAYRALFEQAGFDARFDDVNATQEVLNARPGLRRVGTRTPLALVFEARPA